MGEVKMRQALLGFFLALAQKAKEIQMRFEGRVDQLFFSCLLLVRPGGSDQPLNFPPRSILVIRPDEIGDAVLHSLFLRELRRFFPEARITLVVKPGVLDLVKNCPYVDQILTYAFKISYPLPRIFSGFWKARKFAISQLRPLKADLAICPRWDVDWHYAALMAFWSGAKQRIGFSEHVSPRKESFNPGLNLLYTQTCLEGHGQHEALRPLELLKMLGAKPRRGKAELWLSAKDRLWALNLLRKQGVRKGDMLFALFPGARVSRRRWPIERYVRVASWLESRYPRCKIVVIGGQEDRHLGESLLQVGSRIINLVGKLSLSQSAALFKYCSLFIGNNSGPLHLAAAAGCPVVEISSHPSGGDPEADSAPQRFGAFGTRTALVQAQPVSRSCQKECRAFFPHCILQIDTSLVYRAIQQII